MLLIGLDAAEATLVERWREDGSLPCLARLRAEGVYGRLAPPDGVLVGLPWPSFFTGMPVSEHGLYKYLIWAPERMTEVRPDPEILPLEPFWRRLGADGPRVVAMDVPLVYAPDPFPGVEVAGWATHERLTPPGTHPAGLAGRIEARFGPAPFFEEVHHRLGLGRLLEERDALIEATDRAAGLAAHLLESEPWELGIVCFSATHRAGHKLWSEAGSTGAGTPEERAAFGGALRDVYAAADRAVGRLLELVGPDTTVIAFALHGMGPNGSLVDLLPEMVDAVLSEGDAAARTSWLEQVRDSVPLAWRDEVKRRLPPPVQDRLSAFWRTARLDWSRTRAFCLAADLHGYIRINLRGREAEGIVEPGAEYDGLCRELAEGLLSFVDVRTGEPVVKRVLRRDEIYPRGRRADYLPDLTVVWDDRPAAERDEIRSERFGSVRWPTPGAYPDGRSGNHRSEGFAVARGRGFGQGSLRGATMLDLAPTALDLLGLAPLPGMVGRSWRGARRSEAKRT